MRKVAVALALGGLLALPAAAAAHPSENRAEIAFGGGPHCHFALATPDDSLTYPSHRAHAMQNELKPNGTVFEATLDCD